MTKREAALAGVVIALFTIGVMFAVVKSYDKPAEPDLAPYYRFAKPCDQITVGFCWKGPHNFGPAK